MDYILIVFTVCLIAGIVLIIVEAQRKRAKYGQSQPQTQKPAQDTSFKDFCLERFRKSTFESTYENKEQVVNHLAYIIGEELVLEYTFHSKSPTIINNLPKLAKEISEPLIKEGKFKIK